MRVNANQIARRLVSYKASPAPSSSSRRENYTKRFVAATVVSASAVAVYYAASQPSRIAEARDYSSVVRKTDTADHPRNYKMTITDPASASLLLRTNELKKIAPAKGIASYYFNQVASNSPIEDDHVETFHRSGNAVDWAFFGTFDGHSGWTTSDKLKRELVPYVIKALLPIYDKASYNGHEVADAMQRGFVDLDRDLVYKSAESVLKDTAMEKAQAVQQLMPAMSGSCGLLAFYDSITSNLHVAVTGDSRAIYGTMPKEGQCNVRALSEDQTGSTVSEVHRLRAEHPNEENVVRNGRILGGLEPSRAFGDARYKWSSSVQSKIAEKFYGRRPPAALLSPPYVTARPEVTSTKIDLSQNGFLVMGTDGLYEMLTNEEIAELVVNWRAKFDSKERQSWVPSFLQWSDSKVTIVNEDDERSGQKTPHSRNNKKFVYEDDSKILLRIC